MRQILSRNTAPSINIVCCRGGATTRRWRQTRAGATQRSGPSAVPVSSNNEATAAWTNKHQGHPVPLPFDDAPVQPRPVFRGPFHRRRHCMPCARRVQPSWDFTTDQPHSPTGRSTDMSPSCLKFNIADARFAPERDKARNYEVCCSSQGSGVPLGDAHRYSSRVSAPLC